MTNNMSSNVQIPEIRCEVKGYTGFISLNRPKSAECPQLAHDSSFDGGNCWLGKTMPRLNKSPFVA